MLSILRVTPLWGVAWGIAISVGWYAVAQQLKKSFFAGYVRGLRAGAESHEMDTWNALIYGGRVVVRGPKAGESITIERAASPMTQGMALHVVSADAMQAWASGDRSKLN